MDKGKTEPFGLAGVTYTYVWKVIRGWQKSDIYPSMKQKAITFIAPRIAWLVSLTAIIVHVFWAINSRISMNFTRSGAIVTLTTAILYAMLDWHDPKVAILSGAKIKNVKISDPYITLPLLAVIGTAIWGYGDWMMEKWFFPALDWKH